MDMLLITTAWAACCLYDWGKALPGPHTKRAFYEATGYTVGKPLEATVTCILKALDECGRAVAVKPVADEADREVIVAKLVADAPAEVRIVRARFCRAEREDGSPFCCLVMRLFSRSLADPKLLLPHITVLERVQGLVAAVNLLHSKGYVHLDIKEGNVLVDHEGLWWLADLGACVVAGEPIQSTTDIYHPLGAKAWGQPAQFWHDWHMLAILLLRQSLPDVEAVGESTMEELEAAAGKLDATVSWPAASNSVILYPVGGDSEPSSDSDSEPDNEQSRQLAALVRHLLSLKDAEDARFA